MLLTLPNYDCSTASIVLSDWRTGSSPAIHWTMPHDYLLSTLAPPNGAQILAPMRELTAIEEPLVWKALFDSGETLYTL
jgi:hypothetical protein